MKKLQIIIDLNLSSQNKPLDYFYRTFSEQVALLTKNESFGLRTAKVDVEIVRD